MFRPYSLTSLGAWTVGALAGNHAYYSTKEKQAIHQVADTLTDEYLKYRDLGGELGVVAWLEEKKRNMQLTSQEVAVRTIILEFQGRKLPPHDMAHFVIAHLNIFLNENHLQYKAFNKRPYDWLDNETLFPLFESFSQQFFNEGLSEKDAVIQASKFLGMRIGVSRLQDFASFLQQRHVSNSQSTTTVPQPNDDQPKFTKEFYVACDSQTQEPYSYSQLLNLLKTGAVKPDDLVAYDNAPVWLKLEELISKVETGQI